MHNEPHTHQNRLAYTNSWPIKSRKQRTHANSPSTPALADSLPLPCQLGTLPSLVFSVVQPAGRVKISGG
ncbi:hypothetical protein BDN71DRAFT_285743 [Pleurotus eryngii]|uniref:Uncharacterized protein n=1 Tax=Pleurotus eryngii TaxID=5323 RepID=A0A9P5ZKD8_PLEER|nr:hypothetical protein BDN71DRAFT_285743 [Pleurotus eryngii]